MAHCSRPATDAEPQLDLVHNLARFGRYGRAYGGAVPAAPPQQNRIAGTAPLLSSGSTMLWFSDRTVSDRGSPNMTL
jgi:hypothetical protein